VRTGVGSVSNTFKAGVLELKSAYVKSKQSGTIALVAATSNTATITSVDTTKTLLNYQWFDIAASYDQDGHEVLTNATTVTATVPTSSTITFAYEAFEFI
jgi:hypothetical protein